MGSTVFMVKHPGGLMKPSSASDAELLQPAQPPADSFDDDSIPF